MGERKRHFVFFSEPSDVQGARGETSVISLGCSRIQSSVETHFGIFDNNRLLLGLRIVTRYDAISYMGQTSFHSLAARQ